MHIIITRVMRLSLILVIALVIIASANNARAQIPPVPPGGPLSPPAAQGVDTPPPINSGEIFRPEEAFLHSNYYHFLTIIVILAVSSIIFNLQALSEWLRGISRKSWLILFLIVAVNFIIWLFFTPHVPHIYFDQYLHLDMAHNLATHHISFVTIQGSRDCNELPGKVPAWPPGYHYLLSIAFGLFGSSEAVAFNFSLLLSLLSVITYFILILHVHGEEEVALWSAFLLSISPVFLKYSATYSMEICSMFFLLMTFLSISIYNKKRHWPYFVTLIIIFCFTCYVRIENMLLLTSTSLIFAASLYLCKREKAPGKGYFLLLLLAVPLLYPLFVHISYSVKYLSRQEWSKEGLEYLRGFLHYIGYNILFFFGKYHPGIFTLLALVGIFAFIKKWKSHEELGGFLLLWGILCLIVYSCFRGFSFGSDSERHSLNIYISLYFLSGLGLASVIRGFSVRLRTLFVCLLILILLNSIKAPFENLMFKTAKRVHYHEYEFIKSLDNNILDPDVYVICSYPASRIMFLLDHKAMDIHQFVRSMNKHKVAYLLQYSQQPEYYDDMMREPDASQKICQYFDITPVVLENANQEGFGLYMLTRKESY